MSDSFRLRLPEEQERILIQYIKNRRYQLMISMYLLLAVVVLSMPIAYYDLMTLLHGRGGGFGFGAAGLQLMRRYRSFPGEYAMIWAVFAVLLLVSFLRNFGKKFGPGSDYACVRHVQYTYDTRPCAGKLPDAGKYPYYLEDEEGTTYICPVFLDYKKAEPGTPLLCVHLDNGRHYAMLSPGRSNWWEEDPQ